MPVVNGMEMMIEFNKLEVANIKDIVSLLIGANSTQQDIEDFKGLGTE